jgi:hypothetical protein
MRDALPHIRRGRDARFVVRAERSMPYYKCFFFEGREGRGGWIAKKMFDGTDFFAKKTNRRIGGSD